VKRFYKQVSVTPERGILLDARPVKTPAKALLLLPNDALAEAVADEWRAQETDINPHVMPITGLANAAIDRMTPEFTAGLAAYGESELLCYRAADPPELVAREAAVWDPILDWAQSRYDVGFTKVTGIMHQSQPAETLKRLAAALSAYGPFHIAALSPIVTISGSLVIALAVAEHRLEPDAAFDSAHLDELWQAEQWGEDYFATETRDAHRTDFLAACRFLRLLDRG
jgi:chaperone required for assembly of F1-ATPase